MSGGASIEARGTMIPVNTAGAVLRMAMLKCAQYEPVLMGGMMQRTLPRIDEDMEETMHKGVCPRVRFANVVPKPKRMGRSNKSFP